MSLALELGGKLADGGRLSGAIDADHEHHGRLFLDGDAASATGDLKNAPRFATERAPHLRIVVEISLGETRFDASEDCFGGGHADVGGEQHLLDVGGDIFVDLRERPKRAP